MMSALLRTRDKQLDWIMKSQHRYAPGTFYLVPELGRTTHHTEANLNLRMDTTAFIVTPPNHTQATLMVCLLHPAGTTINPMDFLVVPATIANSLG